MIQHSSPAQQGFTLFELMIALVIFSLISSGAASIFSHLLRNQQILEAHDDQLATLQHAALMFQYDASQAVAHLPAPSLRANAMPYIYTPNTYTTIFPRLGWKNPLDLPRSTVAEVHYEWKGSTLQRNIRPFINDPHEDATIEETLSDHIERFTLYAVTADGTHLRTNISTQPRVLPAALEAHFVLPPFGEIRQLVPLVQTP